MTPPQRRKHAIELPSVWASVVGDTVVIESRRAPSVTVTIPARRLDAWLLRLLRDQFFAQTSMDDNTTEQP